MQTLVRSARRDLRTKHRELPEGATVDCANLPLKSNRGNGDLFVTFLLQTCFGTLLISAPFIFFSNFPCVYTIKLESCLPT